MNAAVYPDPKRNLPMTPLTDIPMRRRFQFVQAYDNRDKRNWAKHIFTCYFEASLISIMKFTMKFHVLAIAVFAIPAIFAEGKWLTIWYSFHSFHVAVDSITIFHSSGRRSYPTPLVSHVGWAFISSRPCSSGVLLFIQNHWVSKSYLGRKLFTKEYTEVRLLLQFICLLSMII